MMATVRAIAGVVGGLVAWMLIATIGNLGMRAVWPPYAESESTMTFTIAMLTVRLVLGAVSSLGAGMACAWITRRNGRAVSALAVILVVMFIPAHYRLWEKFPLWYHVVFFASLVVMAPLGAMLVRGNKTREEGQRGELAAGVMIA